MTDARPGPQPGSHTAAKQQEIAAVVRLISQGGTRSDVLALVTGEWGRSISTADRLIRFARDELREAWSYDRTDLLAQLLDQTATLAAEARAAGNHGAALGCLKFMASLARVHKGSEFD